MQMRTSPLSSYHSRIAPFILLSLLLHAALLFYIRPTASPHPAPMTVYLSTAKPDTLSAAIPAAIPITHRTAASSGQARTLTSIKPKSASFAVQPAQPILHTDPPKSIDSLLESAKSIARDDAIKDEQRSLADQKKNFNAPISAMARELKQPHHEIRLANGMLKIITEAGEVCFQPPPLFARDQKGLYGIPMTCP
jgi:hypothetical protein